MTTLALRQRPVLAASIVGVGAAVLLRLARYLRQLRAAGQEAPFAPGWVPVLGHLPAIMKYAMQNNKLSLGLHAMAVREETGQSVYKLDMPMMGVALTVISDPDLAEDLSHGDPHRFTKDFSSFGSSVSVMMDIMGDTGLFFAATDREDDAWGIAHRILKAPFSTKGMKNMFPVMCEQADKLVEALKRDVGYGGVTHIDKWVTKMAFETIAMCGLGISFGSFDDDKEHPFIEALNCLMCDLRTYAMCPWLLRPILCRSAYRRLQDAKSVLRGTCTEVVRQRREHTTSAVGRGTDLMDMMLNNKDPQTGKAMTEKMIVDNVLTFLFAGQDSTAAAMATCLCFLASCPDAKARLFKEIDEVVGTGDLEWEHLSRLSYLDGCIKETLRLVPPANGAVRAAKGDQLLGGTCPSPPQLSAEGGAMSSMPLPVPSKAERLAQARRDKLVTLATNFTADLKVQCLEAHKLGKRTLTWGAIIPALVPGNDEDLDEVLECFAQNLQEVGFSKVEWCNAPAPTTWVQKPCRFGSHVHMRLEWEDAVAERFE